ncbi:MAG TPA: zinc ribbon domain-containing protein [Allocoleopsis sp.]
MAFVTKEYRCETCGDFEEFQQHNVVLKKCPKCGSKEIERIISVPLVAKDGAPKTVGSQIELNNKRNPLSREKAFGPDAEKKLKAKERMDKIQKLDSNGMKNFIEKGTL